MRDNLTLPLLHGRCSVCRRLPKRARERAAVRTPGLRNPEAGFAVLLIYSMAAIVAILLFTQLPRIAFEAQRDKEQLLIDRGEQYKRAIQLYVRKFNRFPPDFDALDNTQNLRFLRRKYKDPMTGKDDWRIIHVGPGGVFTDSLINKKTDASQAKDQQNFITEIQQTGGTPIDANQNINVGTRQRSNDPFGAPADPNNPGASPQQFDAGGNPVQNPQAPQPVVQPSVPGQPGLPSQLGLPSQQAFNSDGTPTAPGQPFPGTLPGQLQQNPYQQPGQPGNPPTGAAGLINQLLTTPRPGGLNGLGGVQQGQQAAPTTAPSTPGTPVPTATGQAVIGGGIAGVASKLEEGGIKVYNEQKSYHKWEFVYDITKDPARTGATAIPAQNGAAQPQNGAAQPQNGAVSSQTASPGFGSAAGGMTTPGQAPPPPPPPAQQ